ncbi:MAG: sodium-dependent transporter [Ruminococcaceae bacterium]|nr:sodium-dependent transporter [Oscillospiraceae bacterium]
MQREKLGSRLGFILLSAGCAIGIGNVWKFPWMVGEYGGGAFVLLYALFLIVMGVPVMTMEFALGRASRKSPIDLYRPIEPKGTKWHLHGYGMFAGLIILMMFYTSVAGWMLKYFLLMVSGKFVGISDTAVNETFLSMLSSPFEMICFTFLVIIAGFLVCSFSLQKGLERVSKYMMIVLLVIMVALAVYSIFLPGGKEGIKFYLVPDLTKMDTVSEFGRVASGAMQQAFFTLSLGIGSMAIFGSYFGKERSLFGESVNIAILDTFVAITSGLIIFPACFAFGVEVDNGPALIFMTLPRVFNNIAQPFGQIVGSLFFIFLFFAAFTTVIAVFQAIVACCQEKFLWSKKKTCFICCISMMALSLPCVFGFLTSFDFLGKSWQVLDIEDFIVSNLLIPIGSIIIVLFCTIKRHGWGFENFRNEANTGKGLKIAKWMKPYFLYVLPIIVVAVFVLSLLSFFKII